MTQTNLPERIDRYNIERRLSQGGMAEVFLAHREIAGVAKRVVVKSVLPDFLDDPSFVAMMVNEARISVTLSHPNIVRVEDLIQVGERPFIVMEYLDGQNLREILQKAKKIDHMPSLEFVCGVMANVLDGLHHAHERADEHGKPLGLVHRDVSLANVIVTWTGEVKLIDFGIAKATTNHDSDLTRVGQRKGKSTYMSPEQIAREPLDCRSDVFSAGVVLWELLTRKRLYSRKSELQSMLAICKEDAPAPSSVADRVPPELDAICLKALQRDRTQRYQSAREMADALSAFMLSQRWSAGSQPAIAELAAIFPVEATAHCVPVKKVSDDWEDVKETIPVPPAYVESLIAGAAPQAPAEGTALAEPSVRVEAESLVEVEAEPEPEAEPAKARQLPSMKSEEIHLFNQPMPGPSVYDDVHVDGSARRPRPAYGALALFALGIALLAGALTCATTQKHVSSAHAAVGHFSIK
jgi:serine/threonine protein kinase